jgi:hypothetical protein
MLSYAEFVANKLFLEAPGDKTRGGNMPMPPMVMGVLRNIPSANDRATYASVLRWIFTAGLFEASIKREELKKLANQDPSLQGTQFQDFEMYSKEAHAFYEKQGIPLGAFYQREYADQPEKWEPAEMNLSNTSGGAQITINIAQLNQYLQAEGLHLFRYGGTDGLIEFIESGKDDQGQEWAERKFSKSRFSKDGDPSHMDRTGYDVTGAQQHEDDNGEDSYTFHDFHPPQKTDRPWNTLVYHIVKNSDEQVDKARRGEPVDISNVIEKAAFDKYINNPQLNDPDYEKTGFTGDTENQTVAGQYGFKNGLNGIVDFAEHEFGREKYGVVAFLINLAMNRILDGGDPKENLEKVLTQSSPDVVPIIKQATPDAASGQDTLPTEAVDFDQQQAVTGIDPSGDGSDQKSIFRGYKSDSLMFNPRFGKGQYVYPLINYGAKIAQHLGMDRLEGEIYAFINGTSKMCMLMKDNQGVGWKPNVDPDSLKEYLQQVIDHDASRKVYAHAVDPEHNDYSFANYVRKYKDSKEQEPLEDKGLPFYLSHGFKLKVPKGSKVGTDGLPTNKNHANLVSKAKRMNLRLRRQGNEWMVLNPPSDNPEEKGRQLGRAKGEVLTPEILDAKIQDGFKLNLPKGAQRFKGATGLNRLDPKIVRASLTRTMVDENGKKQPVKLDLEKRNKAGRRYNLAKDGANDPGQWVFMDAQDETPFDTSPKPWLASGHAQLSLNANDSTEFAKNPDKNALEDAQKNMTEDPQGYGFGYHEGMARHPDNYEDFLRYGAEQTRSILRSTKKLTDAQIGKITDQDMQSYVAGAVSVLIDRNEFRLGDLNDPNLPSYLSKTLTDCPINDPYIPKIIGRVKDMVRAGLDAKQVHAKLNEKGHGTAYAGFAINGKMWRLRQSVQYAVREVAADYRTVAQSIAGDSSKEGPTSDLSDRIGVNRAGEKNDPRIAQAKHLVVPLDRVTPDVAQDQFAGAFKEQQGKQFYENGRLHYGRISGAQSRAFKDSYTSTSMDLTRKCVNSMRKAEEALQKIGDTQNQTQGGEELVGVENDGVVLAIADLVQDKINQFANGGNYTGRLRDFVNPGAPSYLGKYVSSRISVESIARMKEQLDIAYKKKNPDDDNSPDIPFPQSDPGTTQLRTGTDRFALPIAPVTTSNAGPPLRFRPPAPVSAPGGAPSPSAPALPRSRFMAHLAPPKVPGPLLGDPVKESMMTSFCRFRYLKMRRSLLERYSREPLMIRVSSLAD